MKVLVYFGLQLKRFARAVPTAASTALVLLICIALAFGTFADKEEERKARIEIGIVGDADDTYLSLGMAALQNFDSSRFAVKLDLMSESDAKAALEDGRLSAYIVIPDGFIMNAYYGDVGKLTYVTAPSALSAADFIKDEVLDVISVLLVESQRGIYAAGELAEDLTDMSYGTVANDAAIEYVDLILSRSKLYKINEVGASEGLSLIPSVFCGVTVLLLMLFGIGFAGVFAKKNTAFSSLLSSRKIGAAGQVTAEYFAFFLCGIFVITLLFGGTILFFGDELKALCGYDVGAELFLSVLLSFATLSALQMLIFEITEGIMAGVLSQFFISIFLAYFSGCLYPVYFFPEAIQSISSFLPAGCARALVSRTLSHDAVGLPLMILTAYFVLFLSVTVLVRGLRIVRGAGDAT